MSASFVSLTEALGACIDAHSPLLTVRLLVNHGSMTAIEYRRSFDPRDTLNHGDDETDELSATVALLRRFGTSSGRGRSRRRSQRRYEVKFYLADAPEQTFVSDKLVRYFEEQALTTGTVPKALVEKIKPVAGSERRGELEGLTVTEVRKHAASLKVAGAWRERKAVLIDKIIAAEDVSAAS